MRVLLRLDWIVPLQLADIGASNERLFTGPGEDHDADDVVLFQLGKRGMQLAHRRHVESV